MGIVYEAFDHERHESVALKTLQRVTAEGLLRFKQEFRSLADAVHPNLVLLYELFNDEGEWFFTMELLRGHELLGGRAVGTTSETITRHRMGEATLRDQFRQLALGIYALHSMHRLHRDLKPSNVVVMTSGVVKVLDYGLVSDLMRDFGADSDAGSFLGTLLYMSPEQAQGLELTTATDWYAFGCMLYEALTGQVPFNVPAWKVVQQKLTQIPQLPEALASDVPRELQALTMRLLDRDPGARPRVSEIFACLGEPEPESLPSLSLRAPEQSLVGRTRELAAIHATIQGAARERNALFLIDGPSGIGKSTLLRAAVDQVEKDPTALVLRGRCHEHESVPYNALDGVVDALTERLLGLGSDFVELICPADPAPLLQLFPVMASVYGLGRSGTRAVDDALELRRRGFAALRELLERVAHYYTLVVFIDDLQWGDSDSARLILEILRPPWSRGLCVLGAYPSNERHTLLVDSLLKSPELSPLRSTLTLCAFDTDEAQQLVDRLCSVPSELKHRIIQESAGSPFLLSELAREATHDKLLDLDKSPSIAGILEARVSRLQPAAREVLQLACLLSGGLQVEVALSAASSTGASYATLAELRANGLLKSRREAHERMVEAYHDQVRQAATGGLDESTLRARYHALANAFSQRHKADPEILAECWFGAGRPQQAAPFARIAGESAALALAFDHSAHWFRRALEARVFSEAEEIDTWDSLGTALDNAGRGRSAAQAFGEAARLAAPKARLTFQCKAAHALLGSGELDAGNEVLSQVLKAVGVDVPKTNFAAITRLLLERYRLRRAGLRLARMASPEENLRFAALDIAASALRRHDQLRGWLFSMILLREALHVGDKKFAFRALGYEIAYAATEGDSASEWVANASRLMDELRPEFPDAEDWAHRDLAFSIRDFLIGKWQSSANLARQAEQRLRSECKGSFGELSLARHTYLGASQLLGDMTRAQDDLQAWLRDAEARQDTLGLASYLPSLGFCLLAQNAVHEIPELLRRLAQLGELGGGTSQVLAAFLEVSYLIHTEAPVSVVMPCLEKLRRWRSIPVERVQFFRVWFKSYYGRLLAYAASISGSAEKPAFIRELSRVTAELGREKWLPGRAFYLQFKSNLELFRGKKELARVLALEGMQALYAAECSLYAACLKRSVAAMGSDQLQLAEADSELRALGVRDPWSTGRVFAPGFVLPSEMPR